MKRLTHLGWIAAAGLAASAAAHAQPATAVRAADPLQAGAAVPPVVYPSPFARYRVARDTDVGSWREVNDNVARIGGWRAYARETHQPEMAAPGPLDAPAVPAVPAAASSTAVPAAASSPPAPGHGRH